jgi:transposase
MSTGHVSATHAPEHCPACHAQGPLRRHAMRPSWWRDVPEVGQPQIRRAHIVRWRCPACAQTHSTAPHWAQPGKRMTRDLHAWVRQALQAGQSVSAVAKACGLDEKTVRGLAAGGTPQPGRVAGRRRVKPLTYCT